MKIGIYNVEGKKIGDSDLDLKIDVREDVFKKAVLIERTWLKNSYGASSEAGRRHAISLSKRRKRYRGTYGRGMSRIPRKVLWRRGMQLRYVGAFAPGTRGGRKAHAPKAEKNVLRNINKKEWLFALKVGVVASLNKDIVVSNGQRVGESYPIVLDESFENISKTKDFNESLIKLGLANEIDRLKIKKVRAGKGKLRNRKYKVRRGPLLVVDGEESLIKSARNANCFEVVDVNTLLVNDFAMGIKPGRAVLFSKKAFEVIKEDL